MRKMYSRVICVAILLVSMMHAGCGKESPEDKDTEKSSGDSAAKLVVGFSQTDAEDGMANG